MKFSFSRAESNFFLKANEIALFTDNILHLHHNEIEHECETISGKNDKIARNCLVSTLNCIVMQISKVIREKGYSHTALFLDKRQSNELALTPK